MEKKLCKTVFPCNKMANICFSAYSFLGKSFWRVVMDGPFTFHSSTARRCMTYDSREHKIPYFILNLKVQNMKYQKILEATLYVLNQKC